MSDWSAQTTLTVPFHDLDPLAIVWHGNYAKYFEIARSKLFQSIGYDYDDMRLSGYAWPIVELHIRYPRPLRYGQQIVVTATILEYENRLRIGYAIHDAVSGRRVTHGYTVQIAVKMPEEELCFVCPDVLLSKLGLSSS